MKGFIVNSSSKSNADKTYVELYGRLENGQSFIALVDIVPYFFIREKDAEKMKTYLSKYTIKNIQLTNFAGEKVVQVSAQLQEDLVKIAEFLHKKNIDTYEADLKPNTRFFMDNNILGSIEIKGEYDTNSLVDRIYYNPELKRVEFKPELKMISIDIESDKNIDKLFCIGIYSEKYKQVFMVTDKKIPGVTPCATEKECLEKFKQKILDLDPDIITGWNITDFDFAYLKQRFEKNKIDFGIGRDGSSPRVRVSKDFFKDSRVSLTGRQVLDGLNLIRDPFIKEAPSIKHIDIESWSLEDVSQAILKEGKTIKGKNRHTEIERLYEQGHHKELAEYNLQDCKLAYKILEKTKTIELAIERALMTGMPLDRITGSIAAFDSLYIREARSRGLVSPTTRYVQKEERIKGGYVKESKPGIYHNVLVLDFKSLYPSIIRTFNIDPASYTDESKNSIEAPNGAHFKKKDGILPLIIERLHAEREKAKKDKKELASYAIKIIMNSFFGVLANPNCRYFSLDIANAITHFAQFIIKLTAQKIEEKGYTILYSDTDSVFVETIASEKNAEKIGHELEDYINKFYQEYVKENYDRQSYLELQFDKLYIAFMFPTVRRSEAGSKKRYAGLKKKDGKEELDIVGLEAIRGDWTDAAQEFQRELLMRVFKKEEFTQFIRKYVKDIVEGKKDSKLVYSKSIRKPLEEYVKTTPPHVKAARKLDKLESNVIRYYITTEGPEPIQKLVHPLDYDHYIRKQIEPIANTILFFFGKKFDEVLKESTQTKLFG